MARLVGGGAGSAEGVGVRGVDGGMLMYKDNSANDFTTCCLAP